MLAQYHSIDYKRIILNNDVCSQLKAYLDKNDEYIIDIINVTIHKCNYVSVLFIKTSETIQILNVFYLLTNTGTMICINNNSFKIYPGDKPLPKDHIDYINLIFNLIFTKTDTDGYYIYTEKEMVCPEITQVHQRMCTIYEEIHRISNTYGLYENEMQRDAEINELRKKYELQKTCMETMTERLDVILKEKNVQKNTFMNADLQRTREIQTLKDEVIRLQQLNNDLEATIDDMHLTETELQKNNVKLAEQITELKTQHNQLESNVDTIEFIHEEELTSKTQAINNLQILCDSLTQDNERLINQMEEMKLQLDNTTEKNYELHTSYEDANNLLNIMQKKIDDKDKFINEIQDKHSKQIEKLSQMFTKLHK